MMPSEHVVEDYATISLSLKEHPVSFVREKLKMLYVRSSADLVDVKDGELIKVAGLVLVRQRPGTAKGVCFITIEDEFGCANLVVWEKLFDKYRKEIFQSRLLMVEGKMQREGEVVHIVARRYFNLSPLLRTLTPNRTDELPLLTLAASDEMTKPISYDIRQQPHIRDQKEVVQKTRDFR